MQNIMKYILTLTLGLIVSITCSGQKVKSITSEILWEDGIWYKLSKQPTLMMPAAI